MDNEGIIPKMNEDGIFEEYKEPYCMIECPEKQDYDHIVEMVERGEKLRWIPVTPDTMPNAEEKVFVMCRTSSGGRYVCCAMYIPEGLSREDSDYNWDYECCTYSEEDDEYYVGSGWYERIHNWDDYSAVNISDIVTHWMPLPEPPEVE